MSLWEVHLLPRCLNVMLGTKDIRRHRADTVAGLHGDVVEIGFGSGLNVSLYRAGITTVYAVDPSLVGRKLAAKRVAASSVPIEYVGLDGQELPLADESVDSALSTFTLCTIPDVDRALGELYRVLSPGGEIHFLEHGLARDPLVADRQHRLNRHQRRFVGGCNIDRPIDQLIDAAGFEITSMENDWLRGPKGLRPWGYLYRGVGRKPT
jgi:ubiquinone/menaquinone biosynthesis C-methylase UbiE